MHEDAPRFEARRRERLGSRYARRAREAGLLPIVVYGKGAEPTSVAIPAKESLAAIHEGERVFRLDIEGEGQTQFALLKDVQFDYLGTQIIHADFARVTLDQRIQSKIPVELVGEAVGLKEAGSMLYNPIQHIEIECKVSDLPGRIELDISNLKAGQSITAADVPLPASDMSLVTPAGTVVCRIAVSARAARLATQEAEA